MKRQIPRKNTLAGHNPSWLLGWLLVLAGLCAESAHATPRKAVTGQNQPQAARQISQPASLAGTLGDWQNGNVNGVVNAIAVAPNGDVYVGGSFTMAGTTAALNVAKWNGTTWSALGAGLTYSVVALTVDSNGNVFTAGSTAPTQRLDRWNGTSWVAIGTA